MPLSGNYISNRSGLRSGIENLIPGFTAFGFYGTAAIGVSQAASWAIADVDGNAATIVATAADPVYIAYCSFNLPAGVVADAANRILKLAPAATTVAGANAAWSVGVSASTPFGFTAEGVRSASVPGTWIALTANSSFNLFAVDNTGLVAAGTFGSAAGVVFADVEIIYVKRKIAIRQLDSLRSKSQSYIAAGVAAGTL